MENENLVLSNTENNEFKLTTIKMIFFGFKRFFDILMAIIGLIPLLLLTIVVKIVYILSGDFKPLFFKHERIGKNGKKFYLYKFRTMVPNAEEILKQMLKEEKYCKEWNENHKFEDDPRITKMGKILRKTSLDEIPQVLNILKGDMSLIGPRPLILEEVEAYKNNKNKLLSVRPGLTGWWACNGRSSISNKERMELELYYVDNCSLKLDIKIFFLTIVKVIKRDGAK